MMFFKKVARDDRTSDADRNMSSRIQRHRGMLLAVFTGRKGSASAAAKSVVGRDGRRRKGRARTAAFQESLGGVFTVAQHVKSQSSIHTDGTGTTAASTDSNSSWASSGSPSHHKGAPLLVRRSTSIVGKGLGRTSSVRHLDQPETLGQAMARARTLPRDTDYISSNHVMVNAVRTTKLVQPLVRLPLLDEIATKHAKAMADRNELFHTDANDLADAIQRPSSRLGENVARGEDIRQIHAAMTENAADKNNMIDRRFTSFGVGTSKAADGTLYLCQVYRG